MTVEISLHDLRKMNKTKLMLAPKELHDKFPSHEQIKEAITSRREILDIYESDDGSLDDYDVTDEFRRHTYIEIYEDGEHQTGKKFLLELSGGRVDGESYRILCVDFVFDGEIKERLFLK